MPIDLQQAVVTGAVRRQFGIRGQYSAQLDETIVPVVIAAEDLTDYPWRVDGFRWWANMDPPAVVAQGNYVGVSLGLPIAASTGDISVRAILDTIYVRNSSGAAVANMQLGYYGTAAAYNVVPFSFEGVDPGTRDGGTPVVAWQTNQAAPTLLRKILDFTVPLSSQLVIPIPELPINFTLGVSDQGLGIFASGSLNFGYNFTLSGRWWYNRS